MDRERPEVVSPGELVVCTCGARMPLEDALEHAMAVHGLEPDTFQAALARRWVIDVAGNDKATPRPKPEGGDVSRETRD